MGFVHSMDSSGAGKCVFEMQNAFKIFSSLMCLLQAVRSCGMDWRVWLHVPRFGGRSLSWAEVLLEAEGVALQDCLVMKDRNIKFHPLIYFIFSVKYKYCI